MKPLWTRSLIRVSLPHSPKNIGRNSPNGCPDPTGLLRLRWLILLFWLCLIFPATGQAEETWEGKVIRQVTVIPERERGRVALHPDEHYSAEAIRQQVRQLFLSGDVRDVQVEVTPVDHASVAVRVVIVPRRYLASVSIFGNHQIAEDDLIRALDLEMGTEWTETRWTAAEAAARVFLKDAGHFQATLSYDVIPSDSVREVALRVRLREGTRAIIRSVQFTGTPHFSPRRLALHLGVQPGIDYRRVLVDGDTARLRAFYRKRGYLLAAIAPPQVVWDPKTNGIALTLLITASHRIDIFFEGRGAISRRELLRQVKIVEEQSDDNETLKSSAQALERLYQARGYSIAKVAVTDRRFPQAQRVEVHFQVDPGPRTKISEVIFRGNQGMTTRSLREAIGLRKTGLILKGFYTEAQRNQDTEILAELYRREGFAAAQIKSRAKLDEVRESVIVIFRIKEGVRTEIGQVALSGNAALSTAALAIPISSGQPYDARRIKATAHQIQAAYARAGHLYATVKSETDISSDGRRADIRYVIDEGHPVRMGALQIIGNRRTKARIVLREMAIQPGESYNPEAILKSQKNLYRAGYFSSVRFEPVGIESRPDVLDVRLSVVERLHVPVAFGLGYGEHERLRGFFEIADRNLLGRGQEVRLRAAASGLEEKYTLSFHEPWIFSRRLNARFALATGRQREVTYDLETESALAGIEKRLSDTLKGTLQYQFERHRILRAVLLSPEDVGKFNLATVNVALVRDTRDDPFNPQRGSLSSVTLRQGAKAIGSEVQMVKLSLQYSVYRSLNERFLLAFSARAGAADRFGETALIPPPERFLIGGRNTVRGYVADRLGLPFGASGATLAADGRPIGGNALLAFNEEIRVALPRSFGLVFFFDHGNVWKDVTSVSLSEIKSTVGLGMRYHTPVGPLRLDWGFKLDREPDESASEAHFTLGHIF